MYSKQPGYKKRCSPVQNGRVKSFEIKRDSQEMAMMA